MTVASKPESQALYDSHSATYKTLRICRSCERQERLGRFRNFFQRASPGMVEKILPVQLRLDLLRLEGLGCVSRRFIPAWASTTTTNDDKHTSPAVN